MNGGSLLIIFCLLVGWWCMYGSRGSSSGRASTGNRSAVGHAHGHGRRLLRHEGAHRHAADQTGARVVRAEVRPNGSGVVRLHESDCARMSSRDYMAFMKAGEAASGGGGCSDDRGNVAAERDRMRAAGATPAQIRRTERLATADANKYAASPRVDYWADRLEQKGRL